MAPDEMVPNVLGVVMRLAAGDLAARVPLPTPLREDDLTAVAVGLNMLGEELEALTSGLEREVAARTKELRDVQDQLLHDAGHDHLTQLPNRRQLHQRLEHQLIRERRSCALLLLDLDGFKNINDTLGHSVGDAVLVAVADRLRACLPPQDMVARLGGDEFAALLTGVDAEACAAMADRLLGAVRAPLMVESFAVSVTASLGVVPLEVAASGDDLLRLVDLAMYRAKAEGRNRVQVYAQHLQEQALQRHDVEQGLRLALSRREMDVVYQPVLDTRTLELRGVEALCRWPLSATPAYPPSVFIPVAEQTGQIAALGAAVLGQVCRDAVQWERRTGTVVRFAVNVSGGQLMDADFADRVQRELDEAGATPQMLTLEITESVLMEDARRLVGLNRLRSTGINVAIDDFGTGYSSLAALRRLPIDTLKIDRSFVGGIGTDDDDGTIVRAVLGLARGLGLAVVAEGVETTRQHAELLQQGCDQVQGYLFARPMPFHQLCGWRPPAARGRGEQPA